MNIQTILVPTDFSDHARRAIDYAIAIAQGSAAKVHVLHTYHLPIPLAVYGGFVIPQDFWDQARNAAARKMEKVTALLEAAGIKGESHLMEETPGYAIERVAEKINADLIVMGTRGLSGLEHVLLGSVAGRTVARAPCPVMTVKAEQSVGEKLTFRNIVVAIDFSDPSDAALSLATDIAGKFGPAHITLVHGCHIPVELEALVAQRGAPVLEKLSAHAEESLAKLLTDLQDQGISCEYVSDHGSPDRVILDVAERVDADLIAMGTHGRKGLAHLVLGSMAERVVRLAKCPVITTKCAPD